MKYLSLIICIFASAFYLKAETANSAKYAVDFKLNHPDGIYKKGDKIVATAQLMEDGKPVKGKKLRYVIRHGAKEIKTADASADHPVTIETVMNEPGWCYFLIIGKDSDNKTLAWKEKSRQKHAIFSIGAMVSPLEIKQGAPTPEDFTAFWDAEKKKLKNIPMNVKYKPIPDTPKHRKANFVTIDCGKEFRPANGVLHIPASAKPKSLPIFLFVHGAGVHNPKTNKQWAPPGRGKAKGQNIFLDLNAHGLPQYESLEFFKKIREGELKNYPFLNSTDRDKYYMKGMIIRLIRALEFLKTLPEWNGKDIVVTGGSQGGAQALFAAGADPQVTEIYADVPAMCDLGASLVNRISGWPKLYYKKDGKIMVNQDYNPKNSKPGNDAMIKTAGYFDAANSAKQIKCKTYIRTGGIDGVCPPSSVFSAYNNIPSTDKEIDFSPLGGHCRGLYKETENNKIAKFKNSKKVKDK